MRSDKSPIFEPLESRLLMSGTIDITAPATVEVSKPFQVHIATDPTPTEPLDVKIAPYNGTTRINSDIFNGTTWRSTHYYISDAFPTQSEYNVIINEQGLYDLFVKLRDGSNNITQTSKPINVIPGLETAVTLTVLAPLVLKKRKQKQP